MDSHDMTLNKLTFNAKYRRKTCFYYLVNNPYVAITTNSS